MNPMYVIHTPLVIKGNGGKEAVIPFFDKYPIVLFGLLCSSSSSVSSLSPLFPFPPPSFLSLLCLYAWEEKSFPSFGSSLSLKWPSKNLCLL